MSAIGRGVPVWTGLGIVGAGEEGGLEAARRFFAVLTDIIYFPHIREFIPSAHLKSSMRSRCSTERNSSYEGCVNIYNFPRSKWSIGIDAL